MDIFLAGGNGKAKIISEFFKGVGMDIYLAGGISGNLFPSFRKFITEGGGKLIVRIYF